MEKILTMANNFNISDGLDEKLSMSLGSGVITLKDLTNACFSADAGSNVSSMRINLQTEYTRRLISIVHNKGKVKFDHVSVAIAFNNLNKIKKYAAKTSGANDQTKAHRKHLVYIIDKALDT